MTLMGGACSPRPIRTSPSWSDLTIHQMVDPSVVSASRDDRAPGQGPPLVPRRGDRRNGRRGVLPAPRRAHRAGVPRRRRVRRRDRPRGPRVRAVPGLLGGRQARPDLLEYCLEGTPCAEVGESDLVSYPVGVRERFPADEMVIEMGLDGYLAVPLRGFDGEHLGHLGVLSQDAAVPGRGEARRAAHLRRARRRRARGPPPRGPAARRSSTSRPRCAGSPRSSRPRRRSRRSSTPSCMRWPSSCGPTRRACCASTATR